MRLISEAQLEANRANAQKSTGPRSPAGRKRASLNALKHGCTAQTVILPGEDIHHFRKFHQNLLGSLKPANPHEESLVSTLTLIQWSIDRMLAQETSLYALGHLEHAGSIDTEDLVIQSALASVKTLQAEMETIKTINLTIQRKSRVYETTLRQLLAIQATRKAEEKETLEQAGLLARIHAEYDDEHDTDTPFVSSNYGLVCPAKEIEFFLRRCNANKHPYTPPAPLTNAA
jgi:hypothetical protein